jgi:DnaJ homolog subfamily C member 8
MADATTDEARLQAEAFKADGNALLAEGKYREAVEMYSRAIELDPDNAVYYSNRSAAYLALGDERGSALRDAEKCIALKPEWWKGYSRKGAAEHALLRFDAARATYQMGLRCDPDNASLLQAAEDAYAAGQDHSRRLREAAQADEQRRKEAEAARAAHEKHEVEKEKEKPIKADVTDEDALLAEFMSEVQELEENSNCIKKEEKPAERAPVDFGDADGQLTRLLQPHYEWINLNPFRVLMLETDATEDDIKQHYRKVQGTTSRSEWVETLTWFCDCRSRRLCIPTSVAIRVHGRHSSVRVDGAWEF